MSNRVLAGIFLLPPILLAFFRDFHHPILLAMSVLIYIAGWLLLVFAKPEVITVEKIKYIDREKHDDDRKERDRFRYHDTDLRKRMVLEYCEKKHNAGEKIYITKAQREVGGGFHTVRAVVNEFKKEKGIS